MEYLLWQQTSDSGEDIDSLRGEFESSKEWRLRKKFLEINYGSLPVDRLVCLSRCFINVTLYGCSYPVAVMKDIQERSEGILEEFNVVKNIEGKQRYTDSFVKASSGSASRVDTLGVSTAGQKKLRPSVWTADMRASHRTRTQGGPRDINAGRDAFKKAVTPATSMEWDDYDYWDGQEDVTDEFSFEESMDNSTVPAINTKPDLWSQGRHFIDPSFARSSGGKKLKGKGNRHCKQTNMKHVKTERRGDKRIENFVFILPWRPSAAGIVNVMKRNADLNRMNLKYDYFINKKATQCIMKIEGEVVADVVDKSKKAARRKAALECIRSLRNRCWVLQTKQAVCFTNSVSKEEIQKGMQLKFNQISSDTVGTEISKPVSMDSGINRLNAACRNSYDFNQLLEEFIENYATSGNAEDLMFSSEFSNEEKKLIHEKCRKLKLCSVTRGKGPNRYLCVSKILFASQLFEHVKACGGETAKYKLLPPGTDVAYEDDQLIKGGDVAG